MFSDPNDVLTFNGEPWRERARSLRKQDA